MVEYIFTIGCFDKLHKGHIKLLESMQQHTEKIIVGLHDNNSIEKIKNVSDVDSYDNRKKNLEKYVYDIFIINDIDPTNAIKEYITNNFTENYEIKNTNILKNTDIGIFDYDNFEIFATNFNNLIPHSDKNRNNSFWVYKGQKSNIWDKGQKSNVWDTLDVNMCKNHELIDDSNKKILKYRCLCNSKFTTLPIGNRSNHLYKDDNYIIYNERDYKGRLFDGIGRMVMKETKTDYKSTTFDIHNNSTIHGGSEDYRYIIFNEELYVIMNGLPKNSKQRQMYLYNVKKNKICQLNIKNYDVSNIYQKNWIPYVYKNELYFIYSFLELCVVKLINETSGECELVYGNPSLFTNKTLFGGTNLCHWKNDLFIGFSHIRKPWYAIPIIFDAKNYKYITTTTPIKIKTPFELNLLKDKIVQYPYYFTKCQDKYELSVCHQDFFSIKYEISTDKVHSLFTNLLKYKNMCFMRADDNKKFPGIDYVKSIMPIQYLPYSNEISATKIRDFTKSRLGLMNYLLRNVVDILDENNIPYYLDCGTLLGCIRENGLMEKDTDIDVTTHLSNWDKLNSIDFNKYGLERIRTYNDFPQKESGNMISVKTKYSNLYCDIYTNPAFPQLDKKILNGKSYNIPLNSDLYLSQLYGNWKIPSQKHATTKYHRGNGLVNSEYFEFWDKDFEIFKCNM